MRVSFYIALLGRIGTWKKKINLLISDSDRAGTHARVVSIAFVSQQS